ncbi:tol-pal system-associated acyl-CoA thioesterase [Martelella lutilitoris]|uniref:Tol-pal system-associated acyl-CoA thioesterase n=1 Tax=Martelella lutilitoris TaxID=2583532 RepID=A0A5C4JRG5_9HYPH|nr:tol-pal system-associated acyl-CoA thioesterase [Martelella lutilitoris]TNB47877.1 tol-pal system-associated acyl-CoA thioesterase [Martelella lutilitoris]
MTGKSDGNSADLSGWLEDGEHHLRQRVYYEDTDFSGVVYHARYLHFLERGRTDYLRCLGVEQRTLHTIDEEGLAFAVHHMDLKFIRPARMDDILEITTKTTRATGARMVLEQTISAADVLLTTATVTVVVINKHGRARRMPDDLAATLLQARGEEA